MRLAKGRFLGPGDGAQGQASLGVWSLDSLAHGELTHTLVLLGDGQENVNKKLALVFCYC
jgi:hypothetical protein